VHHRAVLAGETGDGVVGELAAGGYQMVDAADQRELRRARWERRRGGASAAAFLIVMTTAAAAARINSSATTTTSEIKAGDKAVNISITIVFVCVRERL